MTLLERPPTETLRTDARPALTTGRLILRAPRKADAAAVAALINDRRIAENTARVPYPYTLADAEVFIASAERQSEISFLVTLPDGTIIGGCGLGKLRGDAPDIGYWFGVAYWGRGFASEAARAVIDHAFGDIGHDVILGGARVSNPASRRVLEKCGFQWTGVALQRVRALKTSVPCDRFQLDRKRWESLKNWSKMRKNA
jgi:RimJ/RimL family protein N-acetyltransferase